jgi:hypothetical protein
MYAFGEGRGGGGVVSLRSILRTAGEGKIKIVNLIFTDVLDRRRCFVRQKVAKNREIVRTY